MIDRRMDATAWAMVIALSALWGGSFFFVELLVDALPPLTIVLLRVGVAACALWIFALSIGLRPPRDAATWRAFFGMGLLNNVVPFSLIVWGQTEIASGLASILNATTPLFTIVVAGVALTDEPPTRLKIAGVAIGFAGVVAMIGPSALDGFGGDLGAQLAILGAALSYACAGVFGRRFARMGVASTMTAAGQVSASTVLLAPIALAVDRPFHAPAPDAATWAAVLGLALLSTAVAYGLYFRILARAGATNLLLVTFLIPVSAILLGTLALGESLDARQLAGMGLIAAGLAAIDGRVFGRRGRAA